MCIRDRYFCCPIAPSIRLFTHLSAENSDSASRMLLGSNVLVCFRSLQDETKFIFSSPVACRPRQGNRHVTVSAAWNLLLADSFTFLLKTCVPDHSTWFFSALQKGIVFQVPSCCDKRSRSFRRYPRRHTFDKFFRKSDSLVRVCKNVTQRTSDHVRTLLSINERTVSSILIDVPKCHAKSKRLKIELAFLLVSR